MKLHSYRRVRFVLALLTASLLLGNAHAETPELTALRAKLVSNAFFIRGHNPGTKIRWSLQDGTLVTPDTKFHMVSMLQVAAVKLDGSELRIDGTRRIFEKVDGKLGISAVAKEPMVMELDLKGTDLASVLPRVPEMIFYRNRDEALEHTPLRGHLSNAEARDKQTNTAGSVCDCSDMKSDACHLKGQQIAKGLKEPKVLSAPAPAFTVEARRAKASGFSEIYLTVGSDGKPSDIWVAKALGYGLDERAMDAVNQYRFRPAACHGKPIPAELYVDVDFEYY